MREKSQLGDRGGSITPVDCRDLGVGGASYSEETARREGWSVTF